MTEAMRRLASAVLIATFIGEVSVTAQRDPEAPGRAWTFWMSGQSRGEKAETMFHPNAVPIGQADRIREAAKQKAADQRFFESFKSSRKLFYQTDRERRVESRKALAVSSQPLTIRTGRAPNTAASKVLIMTTSPESGSEAPDPRHPDNTGIDPLPEKAPPADTLQAVDEFVESTVQKITGGTATPPARSAMFVLLLVGMFVVPASGIAFLLLGIAHLRGHSFLPGTIILAVGGLLLWGTWSLATTIDPRLVNLGGNPVAEGLGPARHLPLDLFWNSEQ